MRRMPSIRKYAPILPRAKDWPVVQLQKQRKAFIQAVTDQTMDILLTQYPDADALRTLLQKTLSMEQSRIAKFSWRADPRDEASFWKWMATSLTAGHTAPSVLLQKIVKRYAKEIVGRFRVSHYRLADRALTSVFARLLNPIKISRLRTPAQVRARLREKIHVVGAVDELRRLASIGTIVMVPTHFSHLDSILIPWVMQTLGIPPFVHGAGLNLFNNKFFAYFMDKLGAYKVDRRKKNVPYLTTLKAYSSLAMQWGCNSLFYPGGTRSRSGALEQTLKLGLLGTALDAQRCNYQTQGQAARKLFIVPVVLSYPFVLEAPGLIREHLAARGQDTQRSYARTHKLLKLATNFLTKESEITISIGQAMDLLGNAVDKEGHSYGPSGERIDLCAHFCSPADGGRFQEEQGTKRLGEAIVKAYYKANCVLASHLVAFVAYALIRQKHATLAWDALTKLPAASLTVPYATVEHHFGKLRDVLRQWAQAGEVRVEERLMTDSLAAAVQHGLTHVGIYHTHKPLLTDEAGDVTTQDLTTLQYYHNRLTGYDLEKYIQ